MKFAAQENDPIKKAKHKSYKEVMQFARGGMAHDLKARLGKPPHVVDGRQNDVDVADPQADDIQDGLDKAQAGSHGGPQLDPEPARHVGLGEKEEPLGMQDIHKGLKKDAPDGSHDSLLKDLQDHEIEALLSKKRALHGK